MKEGVRKGKREGTGRKLELAYTNVKL